MSLFARRLRWLQNLFPPGGPPPPNINFLEESISPVHQVLNGTERLTEYFETETLGSLAATSVAMGAAPTDKYWYVFACSLHHDDPVARSLNIRLGEAISTGIAHGQAMLTNQPLEVSRAFIIPPRANIQGFADGMAAGQRLRARLFYLELDLGEPAPPSP